MRVAFICLHAYPLIEPRCKAVFGGSEVRAWTFARALSRKPSFSVALIVQDHGQPAKVIARGIEVFRHDAYESPDSWNGTNRPRHFSDVIRIDDGRVALPSGLRDALICGSRLALRGAAARASSRLGRSRCSVYAAAKPDVICVFGVSPVLSEAATYSKKAGCKLVLLLGSDEDLSERYYLHSAELNAYGSRGDVCYTALMQADVVVAQTESQQELLRTRFGREAVVIRNPIDLNAQARNSNADEILWIGKSDSVKRPEIFIQLARKLPAFKFTLLLNVSDKQLFKRIVTDLPRNVRLVERVTFEESDALYSNAAVLVNTSRFEGFPNAFLQAARAHVPIASLTVDPGGMLSREGCGLVAHGNFGQLCDDVERLCLDRPLARIIGDRACAYVEKYHAVEGRAAELCQLIEAL